MYYGTTPHVQDITRIVDGKIKFISLRRFKVKNINI